MIRAHVQWTCGRLAGFFACFGFVGGLWVGLDFPEAVRVNPPPLGVILIVLSVIIIREAAALDKMFEKAAAEGKDYDP